MTNFPKRRSAEGGSTSYLKLEDGQAVKVVIRGEVNTFYAHWVGGGAPNVICEGRGKPCCDKYGKAIFRFRVNVLVEENGAYVAKMLEQGGTLYDSIAAIAEEYALDDYIMRLSRKGKGKDDTVYSIVPAKDGKITKEQKKQFDAIKLLDVKPKNDFEAKSSLVTNPPPKSEEPPFNDEETPF
jgi:hypothetical protein